MSKRFKRYDKMRQVCRGIRTLMHDSEKAEESLKDVHSDLARLVGLLEYFIDEDIQAIKNSPREENDND